VPLLAKTAAALAALLLLAFAPAADAAKRKVPARFVGMNWDSSILAAPASVQEPQFPRMAAAGVETLRTGFLWSQAQPEQAGPIDLAPTDRLVALAAVRRIEVFPHVIAAPDWARSAPPPFAPPSDPQLFKPYVAALIARYGPSGSFWSDHPELPRLPIRYWQFWNEPHLPFQWTLPPGQESTWPKSYTTQLGVFYRAVKAADPGAKVVLAGLANRSPNYLHSLYQAGARRWFDIAAIHPYTAAPAGVVELVRRFRAVMKHNRDQRKPVWVTELGLPASKGRANTSNTLQTTPKGMAGYLANSYTALARALRRPSTRAARVYWYTWASEYTGDIFRYTGLFRWRPGDGDPGVQPAYRAYVRTARSLEGR
jgi:hypothetical protein